MTRKGTTGTHYDDGFTYPGSEYTEDEVEFLKAMDAWKRRTRVKFPTFVDVLRVATSLGYRRMRHLSPDPDDGRLYRMNAMGGRTHGCA